MTKTTLKLSMALLACLLLALPVAAKDIARVSVNAGELVFTPEARAAGFQLTVTGPGGYAHAETFDGSGAMTWMAVAAAGGPLADGQYSYELQLVAHRVKRGAAADLAGAKAGVTALSGTVTVRGGSLVDPELPEGTLAKDQVILDDLIVDGSICAGFDCVNGESFGFDTLRLKENNLRIKFDDTSNSASFPDNDWQLTANDTTNGGAEKFSIDDVTNGRTPFTITAGAPTNSLFVDSSGRLGIGTGTPVVNIHVKTGNTPTLRLEQDGSSGFTAQTWDVAGNETNFFVRDATNGSKLPLRIRPSAPSNSIFVNTDGSVGMGTASPANNLHVVSSGNANIRVTGTAVGFQLEESDSSNLRIQDVLDADLYRIRGINSAAAETAVGISMEANGNTVGINCNDAGDAGTGAQLVVGDGGTCASGSFSAIIAGSGVINTSSRTLKENLRAVPAANVLDKIAGIDVYTYDFISGARDVMGLMAEDFHGLFGRGSDKMINSQEVQMALWLAVQELTAQNRELAAKVTTLESAVNKAE